MRLLRLPVTLAVKGILHLLCRVDAKEISGLPLQGPAIVVVNHINFLEAPMLYTAFYPRPQTSFIKIETLKNPFLAFLSKTWNAIPVRRGGINTEAFAAAVRELHGGKYLMIAPEGTRSGDGLLRKGRPGVVSLARRLNVPIIPVAHYGGEAFWQNLKRLKRTPFHVRVGRPFYIRQSEKGFSRSERQRVADEVMTAIAELLPDNYRGYYAKGVAGEYRFLDFSGPASAGGRGGEA